MMKQPAAEKRSAKKIIPHKTPMPEQDPVARRRNFDEVALGYTTELARREAERCLNCRTPLCVSGCPVQVPIPRFIKALSEGDFSRALEVIKEANLLPAVCGRVCPQERQCEKRCTLGKKFEPVAIGRLERFAADWSMQQGRGDSPVVAKRTNRRVAVVGSGPAGLACAYELAKLGHSVTLFEAFHELGGVLLYGIPEFRLPKAIVAREIDVLLQMGVVIEKNTVVGKLITVDEILDQYDACFIGTGAGTPKFMAIPGEDLNGVYSANEFLTRINFMRSHSFPEYDTPIRKGQRIAVVGGGNVAMDAVRTALRLGADEAIIVYRRAEEDMPARREEVHHAREEGVRFEALTDVLEVLGQEGAVRGIKCIRMDAGEPDASGRRRPVPRKGSELVIPVDMVIMALGTNVNPLVPQSTSELRLNDCGYISASETTCETSREGLFAGGDIVTGSATVISAMGSGRKAAFSIHDHIMKRSPKHRAH
jgi:glutamate synthase (NADPH/NADH) small chain